MKTPITDNFEIVEIANREWVPINECRQIEQDRAELLGALNNILAKLNERSLDGSKRRHAVEQIALAAIAKVEGV
jgi:hypothetical protein